MLSKIRESDSHKIINIQMCSDILYSRPLYSVQRWKLPLKPIKETQSLKYSQMMSLVYQKLPTLLFLAK